MKKKSVHHYLFLLYFSFPFFTSTKISLGTGPPFLPRFSHILQMYLPFNVFYVGVTNQNVWKFAGFVVHKNPPARHRKKGDRLWYCIIIKDMKDFFCVWSVLPPTLSLPLLLPFFTSFIYPFKLHSNINRSSNPPSWVSLANNNFYPSLSRQLARSFLFLFILSLTCLFHGGLYTIHNYGTNEWRNNSTTW